VILLLGGAKLQIISCSRKITVVLVFRDNDVVNIVVWLTQNRICSLARVLMFYVANRSQYGATDCKSINQKNSRDNGGTTLKLTPAFRVSRITTAGERYLGVAEVDEDLAGALLEHDTGDGRLTAPRGGDPLRREPARQPLLDVLPQSDARQLVLGLFLLHGQHLLRRQLRRLGRGGAEREAPAGGGGRVETEERSWVGLGGGSGGEREVGERGGEGGDGERHACARASAGERRAMDWEGRAEVDKLTMSQPCCS
jgi:hypothetical protein